MSQANLARTAGLSPSTVSTLFTALHEEGVVSPFGEDRVNASGPKGGRPARLWTLRSSIGVVVGIDFGKQHVRVAVADLAHALVAERISALLPDARASEHIAIAVHLIDDALTDVGLDRSHVLSVGAGIPGPIRGSTGSLGDSTILPGWIGVNAAAALRDALDLPVEVDNDANLGGLGEWMWGAARGRQDALYVRASTGIGSGLILNGALYAGASGTAGEIGHLIIDPRGPLCRCGNFGCLESIAGTNTILAAMDGPDNARSVSELILRAHSGDAQSIRLLAGAGEAIGLGLSAMCNILNPELIVIGGELALAGDLLISSIRRTIAASALASASDAVQVVQSELGGRAEVLGAVALALRGADISHTLLAL